jgi:hypothetical protein
MSVEKEAAFLSSLKNFAKSRMQNASQEVTCALPYIRQSSKGSGISVTRSIVDGLADMDALGAKTVSRGFRKLDRGLNKADTWAGALIRGNSSPDKGMLSGMWHSLWTSKDKLRVHANKAGKILPGAGSNAKQVLYKEIERPSIMKPVAGLGTLATGYLAQMKGTELLDKLRSKPNEQNEGGAHSGF